MNFSGRYIKIRNLLTLGCVISICAGCAGPRPVVDPVYFPPPPSEPRLQYLTSFNNPMEIEKGNAFVNFLVGFAPPKKAFVKLYGVKAVKDKLYVCDSVSGIIRIIDFSRKKVHSLEKKHGALYAKPINLDTDVDGNIYITDVIGKVVYILRPDGSVLDILGKEQGIKLATDVLVVGDNIYVCDRDSKDIKVFDRKTRKKRFVFPHKEDGPEAEFSKPISMAADEIGDIYVTDAFRFRVQKYDAAGRYIKNIGRHGTRPGEFARPKGIAVDREKRVYVVDAEAPAVQMFNEEGQLLCFFGQKSSGKAALYLPVDISLDYDNVELFREYIAEEFEVEFLVWVISQYGDRRISLYGFGHKK